MRWELLGVTARKFAAVLEAEWRLAECDVDDPPPQDDNDRQLREGYRRELERELRRATKAKKQAAARLAPKELEFLEFMDERNRERRAEAALRASSPRGEA